MGVGSGKRLFSDGTIPVKHQLIKIESCLSGEFIYIYQPVEAEACLGLTYYCHCRSCQKGSGQPAEIGVLVKAGTLAYIENEPRYYSVSEFG